MPITIKKKLENCADQEDDEVKLEVEMSKPSLELNWRKNNVALQAGNNVEMHVEETKHSLFFKKNSRTEQGYYCCETADDKTQAKLTVEKLPICIVKPLRVKIAIYKHKALLECQVSHANAKVKWYKDNKEIKANNKYNLISKDVYRQLYINEVEFSDEDTYTCDAIDEKTSCQLLVEEQVINVVRELRDVEVMEPSPAHFEAEISIKSEKLPKWTLRGELLKANDDVEMEKMDNVYRLIFKNTKATMSGPLQFMIGKSKSVAQLTIFERPLSIVKPIKDTETKENGSVTLSCEFSSSPRMVRWFKGETLLESSRKYNIRQEMKSAELTIQDLHGNDSGEYHCQAGGCESKATLTVEVRRVQIIKHLKDAEVEEDTSAMFICELNYSDVDVQWFLNKRRLWPSNVNQIKHVDNTHSLTLKRLPPEDSVITIQAENASESASLKIKEKPAVFVKPLKNMVGEEEDTISLECEASKPLVFPIWKKDGVVLATSDKYEMLHLSRFISLIIHDIKQEDTGEYCCELGTEQTKSRVTVKDITIDFIKRLKTVEVKEGETCNFVCVLSKYIADEYIWTLNGQPVVSDGRFQISNEKMKYKMSIKEVNMSDSGDVVFTIRNLSSKTMLFVKEKPVMVYRDMQSLSVTPGEDAELSCEVTKCNAKVKWLKDGKTIKNSPRYEFSQIENLVKLVIHNAMITDSGEYCCEVNGATSRARLNVKDLEHIFSRELRDTKAEENGVAILECETRRPALRMTWLKGMVILKPGSKYNIKQQGNILSLTIKGLEKSDSDIYTCDVGTAQSRAVLTVKERQVFFMEELEDKVCLEGDTIMFKCRICPSDYFNVRWYLDRTLLHTDHLNKIQILPGGYHTLTMRNLARKDSGIITLEAGGKRLYAFLLVREKRPKFTKALQDCKAIDGENLVLSCKTSKACHILWYRNGCLIWNSSKYLARGLDNEATLTIYNVNEKDTGWYECHAGPVSTKAQVTVKSHHSIPQPMENIFDQSSESPVFATIIKEHLASWTGEPLPETEHIGLFHHTAHCAPILVSTDAMHRRTVTSLFKISGEEQSCSAELTLERQETEFDERDAWDKLYQHRPEKDWKEEECNELCPVLSDSIMISDTSNNVTKHQERSRKLGCLAQLDTALSLPHSEAEDSTFGLNSIPRQRPIKSTSCSHAQEVSCLSAPGVILKEITAQEQGYEHLRSSLSKQLNEPLLEYREDRADTEGRKGQRGGPSHCITMVKSISYDSGVTRPQSDVYKQHQLWSRSLGDFMSMIPDSTELRESGEKSKKVDTFSTGAFIGDEDNAPENVDTDPEESAKAAVDTQIGSRTYSTAAEKAAMIEMTPPLMVQSLPEEIETMTHVIFAPGMHEELECSSIPETTQVEHTLILSSMQPVKKDLLQQNPLFTKSQLLIPSSLEQSDRPQNMDISLKPLETSQEILSLDPQNKEQGLFSLHSSINITNVELKKSDKGDQVAVLVEEENPALLEIKEEKRPEDRKLSTVEKSESTHKISHINDFQEKSATLQVSNKKTLSNFCRYGSQSALDTIPPSGKSGKSVLKQFLWRQSGTVKSSKQKRGEKLPGHDFPSSLQQQQKAEDLSISTKLMESMSRFSKLLNRKYSKEKGEGDRSKVASPLPKGMLLGIGDASSHKRTPSEFYKLPILKKKKDIHIPLTPVELAAVADTGSDRLAAYKTYSFLSEINRGRFSVVRQCQDDQSKQLFAAKIIPYKQEQQQQVLHEYQLLKKLDHTHIVQLHAAFITPCYLVLIEELCAGRELLHNLAERDLYAEMHVAELLQQILSGVDYLHSSYIVHLDLKSDNILVTDHNLLKIVDLGSAQTFTPGQALSVEHIQETKENKVNIALPKAPEVLEREGVGPETDIWAIGVLVFIMLSGDDPFKSELHWESEDNIRKGKIQFSRCYPGLSEGSVSFIKRTLNYKPWGRPSAAECLQIPWVKGLHHSSRRCHSIVCFSTDKLQAYLGEQETKREKACTKMDVPLLN